MSEDKEVLNAVSLTIKAPNQKIADTPITCDINWTVKQLKEHLQGVYPDNPHPNRQRLIYSGQLLPDHLTIKDFLRQYDEEVRTHAIHLVCAPSASEERELSKKHPTQEADTTSSLPSGLRQRFTATTSHTSTPLSAMAFQYNHQYPYNIYEGLTPEQQQWVYAQYMQQYMFYAQMGYPLPPSVGHTPASGLSGPAMYDAAPEPERPANNAQQQNVRMNAQGNAIMDDDDDEHVNDWLDWIYMFCRISILFSILYFYSSFSRFLVVLGCFFIFYMYQRGVFNITRRINANNNRRNTPQRQPQQPVQQPQAPEEQNVLPDTEQQPDTEREAEPATPSPIQTMWTFLSTFVSSLIPERPLPVNAN